MTIKEWMQKRKEEYRRGLDITIQKRMERQKKKQQQLQPGTIKYGLAMKQKPMEVMRDAYETRRRKRLQKYNKDKKI